MEDKLFSIIRNLREYGNYQRSDANAAKILRRAFPALGADQCLGLIARFGGLYARLSDLIDDHRDEALLLYRENRIDELVERELEPRWLEPGSDRCDPRRLASTMAYFIVHWHLER